MKTRFVRVIDTRSLRYPGPIMADMLRPAIIVTHQMKELFVVATMRDWDKPGLGIYTSAEAFNMDLAVYDGKADDEAEEE